jgi:predicted transcriptional regulator
MNTHAGRDEEDEYIPTPEEEAELEAAIAEAERGEFVPLEKVRGGSTRDDCRG